MHNKNQFPLRAPDIANENDYVDFLQFCDRVEIYCGCEDECGIVNISKMDALRISDWLGEYASRFISADDRNYKESFLINMSDVLRSSLSPDCDTMWMASEIAQKNWCTAIKKLLFAASQTIDKYED